MKNQVVVFSGDYSEKWLEDTKISWTFDRKNFVNKSFIQLIY
ncbi:hypothetical protein [Mesomycoplasma ovipneumoniae]|nr:hypothetical protein [Mesomycoplasma ovipneumoniae]